MANFIEGVTKLQSNIFNLVIESEILASEYILICKNLDKIFNNKKRKQIYDIIKQKPLSILEISYKVNLSYRNTFTHIKLLEKYDLIKTEKKKETQGQEVLSYSTNKTINVIKKEKKDKFILKLYNNHKHFIKDEKKIKLFFEESIKNKKIRKDKINKKL